MKYCSDCGAPLQQEIPAGDHRTRSVCRGCRRVFYDHAKLLVSCVAVFDRRVLLCRRAIEPRLGFWTLPGGFMEADETLQEGAARETREETGAEVDIGSMLSIVHIRAGSHVHVCFRARLVKPSFGPTPESSEVELLTAKQIPWDCLAFRSTVFALRQWTRESEGADRLHFADYDSNF